jgi:hypothetical protein
MNGFKLLGIVPLKDCNERFLKNLKIGEVYKFYQDYDLRCDDQTNITFHENIQLRKNIDLYNLNNGIQVNISAVLGLNGSGKSSLIELLYYFIYKLSIDIHTSKPIELEAYSKKSEAKLAEHQKLLNDLKNLIEAKSAEALLKAVKIQNRLEFLIPEFNNHEMESVDKTDYLNRIDAILNEKCVRLSKTVSDDSKIDKQIKNELNVGVVYETTKGIFSVLFEQETLKLTCLKNYSPDSLLDDSLLQLEDFFYSISLNFSHHSLNNKTLGNWINSLFHKNDAYTTPLVINPMRENGNFNINRELKLNNERLLSTITYALSRNNESKLLGKYSVSEFIFTVKKSITPVFCKNLEQRSVNLKSLNDKYFSPNFEKARFLDQKEFNDLISVKLIKNYLKIAEIDFDFPFLNYAIGYLENKIPKLKETYPQFFTAIDGTIDEKEFDVFLNKDESHITKKIHQTLKYLKLVYGNPTTTWENPITDISHRIDTTTFKNWLTTNNKHHHKLAPNKLMEFAIPGFFNVDYQLHSIDKKSLKISELSSGEQQMLFNINTVVYHLLNLQSVFSKTPAEETNKNRIAYKNVAIILDEIELYYHPDMQRMLVKNLLDALEAVKVKQDLGIESINICFLTHSPFILSDIPKSHILHLETNEAGKSIVKKLETETFGANIHDLLANDFFLKDGFMGEFAKEKIQDLIHFLTYKKDKENSDLNKKAKREWTETESKQLINLIGEEVLRNSLLSLHNKRFDQPSYTELFEFYNRWRHDADQ